MRMTAAMAGTSGYIAMVGGGGTDVWHRSSRLGNHVSLMWAVDGRMDCTCVVSRRINRLHREAGRAALTVLGWGLPAGEEMTLLGEDDNGDPPGR